METGVRIYQAREGDAQALAQMQIEGMRHVFRRLLGVEENMSVQLNAAQLGVHWDQALPYTPAWLAFQNETAVGMAAVLPGNKPGHLVGELVVEVSSAAESTVISALIQTAIRGAEQRGLSALGAWVLAGDDVHTQSLAQAGFKPQELSQLLQTPDNSTLRTHLWGIELEDNR